MGGCRPQSIGGTPKTANTSANRSAIPAARNARARCFRKLFELAEVEGHPHMFRDTFAVELLKHGVALETVSMLLGRASIKVTEKHYKPWVKTLQDKLEGEAMKAWPGSPFTSASHFFNRETRNQVSSWGVTSRHRSSSVGDRAATQSRG
jgi:hypothetical protein